MCLIQVSKVGPCALYLSTVLVGVLQDKVYGSWWVYVGVGWYIWEWVGICGNGRVYVGADG